MSMNAIAILGVCLMLILMLSRIPIGFAFFIVGLAGIWVLKGPDPALNVIATSPLQTVSETSWTVIPMFIFMGFLAEQSGVAQGFFEGARRWLGHFRGGLLYSVILANAVFGACCGSIVAAEVTFATICLPETRKSGYSETMTIGCVGCSAVLSSLIPPSMLFVIYAIITENSVIDLFMAGIGPGILVTVAFFFVIFIWCRIRPKAGPPSAKESWKSRFAGTPGMLGIVILFLLIIIGLYLGIFTPTEAGGVGAVIVLLMGLLKRKITWKGIKQACLGTGSVVGMIGLLIFGAMIFNVFIALTGAPQQIAKLVTGLDFSPIALMLIIIVLYLVIGTFLDDVSNILLTLPLLYPAIIAAGWDPIHLGVMIVMIIIIGGLSPPLGMQIFALSAVTKIPSGQIFKASYPFMAALIICLLLIMFIPELALFIPSTMK